MSDVNTNLDVNAVVAKLQARLGEAMTVIAVLETQLEAYRNQAPPAEAPVHSEVAAALDDA